MKNKWIIIIIVLTAIGLANFIYIKNYKNKDLTTYKKEYKNVDEILDLHKGVLIIKKNGKYGIEKINGEKIKSGYDEIKRPMDSIYIFIKNNKIIIYNIELDKELTVDKITILDNNLIKIFFNDKWGVINDKLELIIENIYDEILMNDKFYILKSNKKNYLLLKNSNIKKKLQDYDEIKIENNEYIHVKENNLWGLIDKKENLIIPNEYLELNTLGDYIFMGINQKNEFVLINLKKNITKILNIDNHSKLSDGYIMVLKEKKIGYINEVGEEIIEASYDAGFLFKKNKNFIQLKKDDKWILLNKKNKNKKYIYYDDLGEFENGYMIAEKNLKFGYIDENGKEKIPLNYLLAENFIDNLAVVGKSSGLGVINDKDEQILDFIYDKILVDKNFILVEKDNRYGLFNKIGEQKVPLIFDKLIPVDEYNIIFEENNKSGILKIDKNI